MLEPLMIEPGVGGIRASLEALRGQDMGIDA